MTQFRSRTVAAIAGAVALIAWSALARTEAPLSRSARQLLWLGIAALAQLAPVAAAEGLIGASGWSSLGAVVGATQRIPMAGMQISPEQGMFMQLLVKLVRARRVIEVGTHDQLVARNGSYAALWGVLAG